MSVLCISQFSVFCHSENSFQGIVCSTVLMFAEFIELLTTYSPQLIQMQR